MDASNPVRDSSKATVSEIVARKRTKLRQNLNLLTEIARGAPRYSGEVLPDREIPQSQRLSEVNEVKARLCRPVDSTPVTDEQISRALDLHRNTMPICGLVDDKGVPFHPSGVHQKGANVSTARIFGGSSSDDTLLHQLVGVLDSSYISECIGSVQYTHGTAVGFANRLVKQMTRKCVSIKYDPLVQATMSSSTVYKWLDELFPLDLTQLPDYRRDIRDLCDEVTTSSKSSAGAPLWQVKGECIDRVRDQVLPVIVDAIKNGTLAELYRTQPELFLVEVKNKTDRYENPEEKTRPYVCMGAHWGLLFSVLSQGLSKALLIFTEGGNNAYGFSAAHGGLEKLRSRMLALKPGESTSIHYGDDADLYYRDREGRLFRVAPDFSQMDGSVDFHTIRITVSWILRAYKKAYPDQVGEHEFWSVVGSEWVRQATRPDLLVNGTKIWKKKNSDGLLSGCIGTTLFDTVKASVAYRHYRLALAADPRMLEADRATAFFKKLGLEVKAGTWVPEQVETQPVVGALWSNQKFLGVQYMYAQGAQRAELVPYLPEQDWVKNLVVGRTDPDASKNNLRLAGRTRFDRLRGLMITGAFSNPMARQVLESVLEATPARDILMEVQADGGKGEQPEFSLVSGEDFHWPSSQGWPTEAWCRDLYFTEDNRTGAEWQPVFPTLEGIISEIRSVDRDMRPVLRMVAEVATQDPSYHPHKVEASVLVHTPLETVEEEPVQEMAPIGGVPMEETPKYNDYPTNETVEGDPVNRQTLRALITQRLRQSKPRPFVSPRKEHWIAYEKDPNWSTSDMPPEAKIFFEWYSQGENQPMLDRAIRYGRSIHVLRSEQQRLLGDNADPLNVYFTPVVPLKTLAAELGVSPARCEREVIRAGFMVLSGPDKLCTAVGLDDRREEEPAVLELLRSRNLVDSGTVERQKTLTRLQAPVPTPLTDTRPVVYPLPLLIPNNYEKGPYGHILTQVCAHNGVVWKIVEDLDANPGERVFKLLIGNTNSAGGKGATFAPAAEVTAPTKETGKKRLLQAMMTRIQILELEQLPRDEVDNKTWGDIVEEEERITVKLYHLNKQLIGAYAEGTAQPVIVGHGGPPGLQASNTHGLIGLKLGGRVIGLAHQKKAVTELSEALGGQVEFTYARYTQEEFNTFIEHNYGKWKKSTSKQRKAKSAESGRGSSSSSRGSRGSSSGSSPGRWVLAPKTERSSSTSSGSCTDRRARKGSAGSGQPVREDKGGRRASHNKSQPPRVERNKDTPAKSGVRKVAPAKLSGAATVHVRGNQRWSVGTVLDAGSKRGYIQERSGKRTKSAILPNK